MIHPPGLLLTILAFALVIGPLVFIHEAGHYVAGRLCGVKVDVFSIGFGREVAGFSDRRGTRWKFGWLPLGGYVKFAGDLTAAGGTDAAWLALPAAERMRTFPAKPVWQRAAIVAAGPLVNLLLAVSILAGFAVAYGEVRTPAVAGGVMAGGAAARAGIEPGDRIVRIGSRDVASFADLVDYVRIRPGERVSVALIRHGEPRVTELLIAPRVEGDRFGNSFRIGRIGIESPKPVLVSVGAGQAVGVGVRETGGIIRTMVETLGQVVGGRRSVKELGGPISIARASGEQLTLGPQPFVFLIALISINLGFINLLPVPLLDGGHLFFYAIEAVRRRPVPPHVQEWAFRCGLAALLFLMMIITFNDLGTIGIWKNLTSGAPRAATTRPG